MTERRQRAAADSPVPAGVIASMAAPGGYAEGRRRIRRRGAGSGLLLMAAALAVGLGSVAAVCKDNQVCGDGVVDEGEQCDDRNTVDRDGCSSSCMVECGFECQGVWAACAAGLTQKGFFDSSCRPLYGDGLRVTGEACDDGNLLAGDGCQCHLATKTSAGRCSLERNWDCNMPVDLATSCASTVTFTDICECVQSNATVTLPAAPLFRIPERQIATTQGFAGKSVAVGCSSCACNHYGTSCDTSSYCHFNLTCSSHGFCDGDGKCVCLGNYQGRNCNKCKCNWYGEQCDKWCDAATTCGAHGVCDSDGGCVSHALCEGVAPQGNVWANVANVCGDGKRLGGEECDDGNLVAGDGCDAKCRVEESFVCMGGCQTSGDLRRRYGECQKDVCTPAPCGWALMTSVEGSNVLEIIEPTLSVSAVQSTQKASVENTVTLSITFNVPVAACIGGTFPRNIPDWTEWLAVQKDQFVDCEKVRLTVSNLTGARPPGGTSPTAFPLSDLTSKPEGPFGIDASWAVAEWDAASESLSFQILDGFSLAADVTYTVSFKILNPEYGQSSPDIRVAVTGLDIPSFLMDKVDEGNLPPLEILGPERPAAAAAETRRGLAARGTHAAAGGMDSETLTINTGRKSERAAGAPQGIPASGTHAAPDLHHAPSAMDSKTGRKSEREAGEERRATAVRLAIDRALEGDGAGKEVFHRRGKKVAGKKSAGRRLQGAGAKNTVAGGNTGAGGEKGAGVSSVPRTVAPSPSTAAPSSDAATKVAGAKGDAADRVRTREAGAARGGEGKRDSQGGIDALREGASEGGEAGRRLLGADASGRRAAGDCDGLSGVCRAPSVTQGSPYAGTVNQIDAVLEVGALLPPDTRISIRGLLPARSPLRFAVTSSTQCAQDLAFGPSEELLHNPVLLAQQLRGSTGFISTVHRHTVHSAWVQELFDGADLKFRIFWSFSTPKTLQRRFHDAANGDGEAVTWSVRLPDGSHADTMFGTWKYSANFGDASRPFAALNSSFQGFSADDGLWGGGTGTVDGSLTSTSNPIYPSFWGQGNFNQLFDSECDETTFSDGGDYSKTFVPCCGTYWMKGVPTKSPNITNYISLLPCETCQCPGANCKVTAAAAAGAVDDSAEINVGVCGVVGQPGPSGWYQSWEDSVVRTTTADLDPSANPHQLPALPLNNPLTPRAAPEVSVAASTPTEDTPAQVAATAALALEAPMLVLPAALDQADIRQSSTVPGALNTLTVTISTATALLTGTSISFRSLLDPATPFASITHQACGATLPTGTDESLLIAGGYLSLANLGKQHSYFRQELWADGKLRMRIMWGFAASATLESRLAAASQPEGTPVEWTVIDTNNSAVLARRSGFWRAKGRGGGNAGQWGTSNVAWGAANGLVDGEVRTTATGVPAGFWGFAGYVKVGNDVYTTCLDWFEGADKKRAVSSLEVRIALEDTPLISWPADGKTVVSVGKSGSIEMAVLRPVPAGGGLELRFGVLNPLQGRNASAPTLHVVGCAFSTTHSAVMGVPGDEGLRPLQVFAPRIEVFRMGQSTPNPGSNNTLSCTMMLNFLQSPAKRHFYVVSNLKGAFGATGAVALSDWTGANAHLRVAATPGGTPGFGYWNDSAKTVTSYVVASIEAGETLHMSMVVENSPAGQDSPPIYLTTGGGAIVSRVADPDASTVLAFPVRVREINSDPGYARPLLVLAARWTAGTSASQATQYPLQPNRITLSLISTVTCHMRTRTYDAISITVANFSNAKAPTGPVALSEIACTSPPCVWEADSTTMFAATPGGTPKEGYWDASKFSLTLYLLREVPAFMLASFSFAVTNPAVGQAYPPLSISSTGLRITTVDTACDASLTCLVPSPSSLNRHPLFVEYAAFTITKAGQSNPNPGAANTITVTMAVNVPLLLGVVFVLSNVVQAKGNAVLSVSGETVAGLGVNSGQLVSATFGGASYSASLGEDNAERAITFHMSGTTNAGSVLVLRFSIHNPATGQPSPPITIEARGIPIAAKLVSPDVATILAGIYGAVAGDAAPLLVYTPAFRMRSIGQKVPYPSAANTLCVTFALNVDALTTAPFSYDAWAVTISGLLGAPSLDADVAVTDQDSQGHGHLDFAAAPWNTQAQAGAVRGLAKYKGTRGVKAFVFHVMSNVNATDVFSLCFPTSNPAVPQEAPSVTISSITGLYIAASVMSPDLSSVPGGIYLSQAGWAAPMKVIAAQFRAKAIGQSTPLPGNYNTITVTLVLNVPLSPLSRRCNSRWVPPPPTLSGFMVSLIPEDYRDVSNATRMCDWGMARGVICTSTDACQDPNVLITPGCQVSACHADEEVFTRVRILGLAGAVAPAGALAVTDPSGNSAHLLFSSAARVSSGGQGEWDPDTEALDLYVVNATLPGVNYTLAFTIQNPLASQDSPPVSIAAIGVRIEPVGMNRDFTSLPDGDSAPVKVLPVLFSVKKIAQSNPYPFGINNVTVTLATNLDLVRTSSSAPRITIYPLKEARMDDGVPGYDPALFSVALEGPDASLFSHRFCTASETSCGGTALWDSSQQQLIVFLVREAPGGVSYTFSFRLRNPGVAQASVPIFAALQIEATRFPAAVMERDLTTDLSPTIPAAGVGDAAIMKVLAIKLFIKKIGQSIPYPSAANTITVTIGTSLPLPRRAGATLTFSGLAGGIAPAGDIALSNKECLGSADPGDWNGCEAFAPVGGGAPCTGTWNRVDRSLSVSVIRDLDMLRGYAFSFHVTNPPSAQVSPAISIRVAGPIPIALQAMSPDITTDLSSNNTCHDPCFSIFSAVPGDAAPLYVLPATFLCLNGVEDAAYYPKCSAGPLSPCLTGSACAGYIGQSSPYPGSVNTITVTYATSVPLTPGAYIILSGFTGGSRLHDASPEIGNFTNMLTRVPRISPGCDTTGGGFSVGSSAHGDPGTYGWSQARSEVQFYNSGTERSRAAWEYVLSFTLLNPPSAQESPAVYIESFGVNIPIQPLFKDSRRPFNPPLKVIDPAFVVKNIGQMTALPGSENIITVTFSTNVPLNAGMILCLSGFNDGIPAQDSADTPMLNASSLLVDQPLALYTSDVTTTPGTASWDYDILQFKITENTIEFQEYKFMIRIKNPSIPQDYKRVSMATLSGILISKVEMDPDLSNADGIYAPFRILEMVLRVRKIGQSTPFPGAENTLTVTFSPNLDIDVELAVSITISGLTGSITPDYTGRPLMCDTGCADQCETIACDPSTKCCSDRPDVRGRSATCADGVRRCATLPAEEERTPCDPSFFSGANWFQASGTLVFLIVKDFSTADETAVSFTLRNSLSAQPARALSIKSRFRNNTESLTAPQPLVNDQSWPPLLVEAPRFLRAYAAQRSSSPCSLNTLTVTLALNIPVVPGGAITISGISGIEPVQSPGTPKCMIDFLQLLPECSVDLAAAGLYETATFGTRGMYRFSDAALVVTAADGAPVIPAGVPFTFSFQLFNPKGGQEAPALHVHAPLLHLGGGPEHGGYGPAGGGVSVMLASKVVEGCRSPQALEPLRIDAPFFSRKVLSQSSPFPGAVNILTLTLATNVGLPLKCKPELTLSGLRGASAALVRHSLPGTGREAWRGDMCPATLRQVISIEALNGTDADALFSAAPLNAPTYHTREGDFIEAESACEGRAAIRTCLGNILCVSEEEAFEARLLPWQLAEAEVMRARGQVATPPSYPRRSSLAPLGDGVCDAEWNCGKYAWDDGDCAGGRSAGLNMTHGTAKWSDAEHGSIVMYLTKSNIGGEEYVLQFQVTNPWVPQNNITISISANGIVIAPAPIDRSGDGALCETGKVKPEQDPNPLNVYGPHYITVRIDQTTDIPGVLNTLSVTLTANVHISPRMMMPVTISGLAGASAMHGLMNLTSPHGDGAHLKLTPPREAAGWDTPPGSAWWDNEEKTLSMMILADLFPNQDLVFSFKLWNPRSGQTAPDILIGSEAIKCPPSARPMSSKMSLRVYTTRTMVREEIGATWNYPPLPSVQYMLSSLESEQRLGGCLFVAGVDDDGIGTILVPGGDWQLTVYAPGFTSEIVEFRTQVSRSETGLTKHQVWEGSACLTGVPLPYRSLFQDCRWWPRMSSIDIFLHPITLGIARFVMSWGDTPRDMDVYVRFAELSERTAAKFDYMKNLDYMDDPLSSISEDRISDKYRCTNPNDECAVSGNPDCDPEAWENNIIVGGGLYWACTVAEIRSSNLGVTTRIQIERDDTDGNGPEVVRFQGLPDGEYHLYATVYTAPPNGRFIGAEEARVYLPDGTSQRVYTSVRASEGGRWWHVGYFVSKAGSLSFAQLNYNQLEKSPIRFKDGWELELQVTVRSGKDGSLLSAVQYTLSSPDWDGGDPIEPGDDPAIVSEGALPNGRFSFENSARWWLGDAGEPITYIISLSKPGYVGKSMKVTYENGSPGELFKSFVFILAEDQPKVTIMLSWEPESGQRRDTERADLDLWLFPCSNSGSWTVTEASRCNRGQPRPDFDTEGTALAQGAVYWGCPAYKHSSGAVLTQDVDALEGPGPESVSLTSAPDGNYDIWVNTYEGAPLWGSATVDIVWVEQDLASGKKNISSTTIKSPSDQEGDWWHVGYITLSGGVPILEELNIAASSPEKSGCRIHPKNSFKTFTVQRNTTTTYGPVAGVTMTVPAGVWPEGASTTLGFFNLLVLPVAMPSDYFLGGPIMYFEPSGISFNAPGITISNAIVLGDFVNETISAAYPLVSHRASGTAWTPLQSNTSKPRVGPAIMAYNTRTFSAYAPFFLPPAATPPATTPPPTANNKTLVTEFITPEPEPIPIGAIVGGAVGGGLLLLAGVATATFKARNGRYPWQKKEIPYYEPDPAYLPFKDPSVVAIRERLLASQALGVAKGVKAENRPDNLEARSEAVGLDVAKLALTVKAAAILEGGREASSLSLRALKSPPATSSGSTREPPAPISDLIRSGVLMPNRSSVVDRPVDSRRALGDGAPTKLEVPGDISVICDFARTTGIPRGVTAGFFAPASRGGTQMAPTSGQTNGSKVWKGGLSGGAPRPSDDEGWGGEEEVEGEVELMEPIVSDRMLSGLPWLSTLQSSVASITNPSPSRQGPMAPASGATAPTSLPTAPSAMANSLLDSLGFAAPLSHARPPVSDARAPESSLGRVQRGGAKGTRTKVSVAGPRAT